MSKVEESVMGKKAMKSCHGCGGKGWVPVEGEARICPVCRGSGKVEDRRLGAYPRPEWPIAEWRRAMAKG